MIINNECMECVMNTPTNVQGHESGKKAVKALGIGVFAFFLVKGLIWLLIGGLVAWNLS